MAVKADDKSQMKWIGLHQSIARILLITLIVECLHHVCQMFAVCKLWRSTTVFNVNAVISFINYTNYIS